MTEDCLVCGKQIEKGKLFCGPCKAEWRNETIYKELLDPGPDLEYYTCICGSRIPFRQKSCPDCQTPNPIHTKFRNCEVKLIFDDLMNQKTISTELTEHLVRYLFNFTIITNRNRVKEVYDQNTNTMIFKQQSNWLLLSELFERFYPQIIIRTGSKEIDKMISSHISEVHSANYLTKEDLTRIIKEYDRNLSVNKDKSGYYLTDREGNTVLKRQSVKNLSLEFLRDKFWTTEINIHDRVSKKGSRKRATNITNILEGSGEIIVESDNGIIRLENMEVRFSGKVTFRKDN